jgi:uncharacterized protein (DUF2336 family)
MIVRQFLQWMRTAGAAERADATAALARAYLYSELGPDDRAAAEGALIMLLDDPSPVVRAELARALAFSEQAPPAVILGLAADQPEVASWVIEHSPLLLDTDLVDAVATGGVQTQSAIANRNDLPRSVSAAIAEVGAAEACLILVENATAQIASFSFDRIVARFGHLGAVREAMLASFVAACEWLQSDRAQRVAKEACEKATVMLAAVSPEEEIKPLIRHLRESGQLNAGLMLRLPVSTYPAFREAVDALHETGFDPGGATRLKRRMVERVLTRCADEPDLDAAPLLTLLRRFAAEAAREEARMFCDELVAADASDPFAHRAAA